MTTATAPSPPNSPTSLGAMIDELARIRAEKKELKSQIQDLDEIDEALEHQILDELEAQGMQFAGGSTHRAGLSTEEVPTVEDWDQAIEYMKENDAFYLFQRRMAAGAWRELRAAGEEVPGTKPFKKRKLSLRKI